MFTADEFRQFAEESLLAARSAKTDVERKHYLDMAKMWTIAAAQADGTSAIPQFPGGKAE